MVAAQAATVKGAPTGRTTTSFTVRRYFPHVLAFISGAIVLLLEILSARILAPYLGTAFLVWVNIIGTILASLSLGYYCGGILADRNPRLLPYIFFGAAVACALLYFERPLLPRFGALGLGWGSLLAAILFFAPASALLGMVSPYLLKLAANDPTRLGRAFGGINAASTLGSIAGTFAGGFWLIPNFPISQILGAIVVLLVILAVWSAGGLAPNSVIAIALLSLTFLLATIGVGFRASAHPNRTIFEKNSRYYNIRVNDVDNGRVRLLMLDGTTQSSRYVGMPGTPFPYVKLSANLIQALKPSPDSVLALGGGGYSIPQWVKQYSPRTDVTVVEIDPEVTAVAERFFMDDPAIPITTINEDARLFLNRNQRQFEVVYTDAYSGGNSVPPALASREALQRMRQALQPNGIVVFNILSAREGRGAPIYGSLLTTIKKVFAYTAVFSTVPEDPFRPQNIIVVAATKAESIPEDFLQGFEAFRCRESSAPGLLLTDDYAPTDYLTQDLMRSLYPLLRQFQ